MTNNRPAHPWLLTISLVMIALNMRPALASIAPVLETIREALGLSGMAAGLLTTIPSLCMGVFAFFSAATIRRFGLERSVSGSLALLGIATLARFAGHNIVVLYASTVAVGAGIAIAQAMLPSVVGRYFPHRSAMVTGIYTAGFNAGAALAAAATVPLASVMNSWTASLAVWAVLVPPAMLAWHVTTRQQSGHAVSAPVQPRGDNVSFAPWRQPRAWFLGLFLGGSGCLYLSTLAWLAPRYHAAGLSAGESGFLFAYFTTVQIAGALIAPALAQRTRDRRPWLALLLTLTIIGMGAIAFSPMAVPYVFVTLIGLGIGGVFPLALTLPLDYARTPEELGPLTAMTLGVGYLLGALGPLVLGTLNDLTGNYRMPFAALAGVALLMLIAATVGLKPRG